MYVGRKKESAYLSEVYQKEGSGLYVLYGCPGIGKTALALRFAKGKSYSYYQARSCAEMHQKLLWMREAGGLDESLPAYYDIFRALYDDAMEKDPDKKFVLMVDEFQDIIRYSDSFMDDLVEFVETAETDVFVLLISSSISFVENDFVPRIGKLSQAIKGFYKLPELGFLDCVNFFSKYSTKECMEVYSILGGIPAYWEQFSDEVSVKVNIIKKILNKDSMLCREGMRLVEEELRETSVYCTILHCMANGMNKLNDLHLYTNYSRAKISVYLRNLMEMELVKKVFPFDGASLENARKGLYRIGPHFLLFYFRFIYGNASQYQCVNAEEFYENYVSPDLDAFYGESFSRVCREYLSIMNDEHGLPIDAVTTGEWPGKKGSIDIVMQDQDETNLLAFCISGEEVTDVDALDHAFEIAENASLAPDYIYIFSRGSFTDELREEAEKTGGVTLIGIDDL